MTLREYAEQQKGEQQKTTAPADEPKELSKDEKRLAEYEKAKIQSAQINADILKGIQKAENPCILLLKAAECIGILTGDIQVFPKAVKDGVIEIYGQGLNEPNALNVELVEVRRRLLMLERSELTQTANTKAAIKAHKERESEILSLLGQ